MKSRNALAIVALIAVVSLAGWLAFVKLRPGAGGQRSPTVTGLSVTINEVNDRHVFLTATLTVENRLPLDLTTNGGRYRLFINDTLITEGMYKKKIALKADSVSTVSLPVRVDLKPLSAVLAQIGREGADSADYRLESTITVDLPVKGYTHLHFNRRARLPAIGIPRVKVEDVDISKLALKKSEVLATLVIDNPNRFPMKLKNADYQLTIGKELVMSGKKHELTTIPARDIKKVPVKFTVKNANMMKFLSKQLFNEDKTQFSAIFKCQVVSNSDHLKTTFLAMHAAGTAKEFKKKAKDLAGKK